MYWLADYINGRAHSFNVVKVKEVFVLVVQDRKLTILCMLATSAMIDFCYGINLSRVAASGLLPWIISPVQLQDTVPEKRAKPSFALLSASSAVKREGVRRLGLNIILFKLQFSKDHCHLCSDSQSKCGWSSLAEFLHFWVSASETHLKHLSGAPRAVA